MENKAIVCKFIKKVLKRFCVQCCMKIWYGDLGSLQDDSDRRQGTVLTIWRFDDRDTRIAGVCGYLTSYFSIS